MPEVDRVEVKVTPDLDGFRAKVAAELAKIRDLQIEVNPDLDGFREKVRAELTGLTATVNLDVDRSRLDMWSAQAAMQSQASANPIHQPVEFDFDRDRLRRAAGDAGRILGGMLGSAGRFGMSTVGIAGLGIAGSTAAAGLGAAAVQAVPLAAALSQMAGAAPLVVSGLAGAGAAAATLVVGLHGVSDAFKDSSDPEAYAESLEKLAPSAQDFVKAGVGMKDTLHDIRMEVQQGLFDGLDVQLRDWNRNLIPALQSGMSGMADSLNDAAESLMRTLGSARVARAIETLFGNTSAGTSAAAPGFGAWTSGFINLAAGASTFFEQLGQGFTNAGERFDAWVSQIVANGQLDRWVRNGIAAFQDVASILGNIGSGLAGIFRASSASGQDMLSRFDGITEAFASWTNGPDGQQVLGDFFDAVSDVTAALGPVAGSLLGLADNIAQGVAGIATAFAPFADRVLQNLEPAIDVLAGILEDVAPPFGKFLEIISASLAPAFENMGPGVEKLFRALADSAPAIGEVLEAVGSIGGTVLEGIADVLPTIADWLSALAGFLADVVEAIGPVPAAIAAFVAALAIKGIGGGAGGAGLLGIGKGKGLAGLAGLALMIDAAMSEYPETGEELGWQFAEGFAGGVTAGFAVGGPVGAAIGGALGAASAFHPVFMEAGEVAANTFASAFNDEVKGKKFTPFAGTDFSEGIDFGKILSDFNTFTVPGHGTNITAQVNPDLHARETERAALSKQYYAALEKMYKDDYEIAKKYEYAKSGTREERIIATQKMQEEYAAKQEMLWARGPEAVAQAEKRSYELRKAAAEKSWGEIKSFVSGSNEFQRKSAEDAASGSARAWSDAASWISSDAEKPKTAWVGAGSFISQNQASSAKSTSNSWTGILPAITGTASSASGAWKNAAAGAGASVKSSASGMVLDLTKAGNAGKSGADKARSSWFGGMSSAKQAVLDFYGTFNTNKPQQASAAQASGAANQWSGMFGRGSALGGMFGDGLASGISSRYDAVADASASLAREAERAMRLAARIASPSKVATELGEYWGDGVAVGIESKAARVSAAASSLARAANVSFAADESSLSAPGFPDTMTLVDRDGSILANVDVRADRKVATYDRRQTRVVSFGVKP